ncbi:MAG: (Fe-S)-binding protein [Bacteroidetes bacterium]|nr:(Fe-S)-binding protein [Bacteroidota bacterium]
MLLDLFVPCYIDHFYPDIAIKTTKLLEQLGHTVNYNSGITCCGRPAMVHGHNDLCKEAGEKIIKELSTDRPIICPDSYCAAMLRVEYKKTFHNSTFHNEYNALQKKVFELGEFIVLEQKNVILESKILGNIVYYESCHMRNDIGSANAAKILLANNPQIKLIEIPGEAHECCGCHGAIPLNFPNLSAAMAQGFIAKLQDLEVDYVVSSDMLCLHQLKTYYTKGNAQFVHWIEAFI